MAKTGKMLERIVATLEGALRDNPSVSIETNVKLPDRVTGQPRQFDVLLTVSEGHHHLRIALECKDHSRPIGVPTLESFCTKCRDTDVDQGIIVSKSGFCKTTLTKAEANGIRCFELSEVSALRRMLPRGVNILEWEPRRFSWTLDPKGNGDIDAGDLDLVNDNGETIDVRALNRKIWDRLVKQLPRDDDPSKRSEVPVRVSMSNTFAKSRSTGEVVEIKGALLKIEYSVGIKLAPFTTFRYSDAKSGEQFAEMVVASMGPSEEGPQLAITFAPGGQVKLMLSAGRVQNASRS